MMEVIKSICAELLEQRNAGELARVGLRLALHEVMVVPTSWTERCHLHVYALVQRPAGKRTRCRCPPPG